MMSFLRIIIALILPLTLGCTARPIKSFVSEGHPLSPIKKVLVLKKPDLEPRVVDAVKKEFAKRNIVVVGVENQTSEAQFKSDQADTVMFVSAIVDRKFLSYLRKLEARIYDAKSGTLMGTSKWEANQVYLDVALERGVPDLVSAILERTQQ